MPKTQDFIDALKTTARGVEIGGLSKENTDSLLVSLRTNIDTRDNLEALNNKLKTFALDVYTETATKILTDRGLSRESQSVIQKMDENNQPNKSPAQKIIKALDSVLQERGVHPVAIAQAIF